MTADSVEHLMYIPHGKVVMQAFDNNKSVSDLFTLNVSSGSSDNYIPINFVVCLKVSYNTLLSLSNYRRLQSVDNNDLSAIVDAFVDSSYVKEIAGDIEPHDSNSEHGDN